MTAFAAATSWADIAFAATVALGILAAGIHGRYRCNCPGQCHACPPLTDDTQADAEYHTTRHLFHHGDR